MSKATYVKYIYHKRETTTYQGGNRWGLTVDGLEDQHHRPESDVGRNRKPAEVTEEEGGHVGEFGKIVNGARCSGLVTEAGSPDRR